MRQTVYTYSATIPNQEIQQHTDGLGVEYFQYDHNGNTTSLTSTDYLTNPSSPYAVNTHLAYDSAGRPITVTLNDRGTPITVTMAYNAEGLRSRYTASMSGTITLDERIQYRSNDQSGQDEIAQVSAMTATLNADGSLKSTEQYTDTYLHGSNGAPEELLRQLQGQEIQRYWYVLDGRGNVVALTDSSGTAVDHYAYDPWGEGLPEGTSETVPQPWRYAGYWWDQELGWYWVQVRSYDPEGRWLQPDPSEQDGVRTYAYVNDDPVDATDPTGLYVNPCSLPYILRVFLCVCEFRTPAPPRHAPHRPGPRPRTHPRPRPRGREDLIPFPPGTRDKRRRTCRGEIVYHYTSQYSAYRIYIEQQAIATPSFRAPNFTYPSGVYGSVIPPIAESGYTQRQLSAHFFGGNEKKDMSYWVMFCSDDDGFYPTGSPTNTDLRYLPAPPHARVPVHPIAYGKNGMEP